MTQVASLPAVSDEGPWLRSRTWDRTFVTGGAYLVAVPIVLFYALRWSGAAMSTWVTLFTLFVMVFVCGPPVIAPYTRPFC